MDIEIEDDLPDPVVRNPPPEIFLNVGPIEVDCDFSELDEVCWASEGIDDADIKYVLASEPREIDGLMAKIYQLEEQIASVKSRTADELFEEAKLHGYLEPSRREGPPDPKEADQMSSWDIDISMARQGQEGWSDFADKAIAIVRRLEDLRRWRPMSEHPTDGRWVLGRAKSSKPESLWSGREIPACVYCSTGTWHDSDCKPFLHRIGDEWTYIPGQEPKEEV